MLGDNYNVIVSLYSVLNLLTLSFEHISYVFHIGYNPVGILFENIHTVKRRFRYTYNIRIENLTQ